MHHLSQMQIRVGINSLERECFFSCLVSNASNVGDRSACFIQREYKSFLSTVVALTIVRFESNPAR
jgi:hypothetical protein